MKTRRTDVVRCAEQRTVAPAPRRLSGERPRPPGRGQKREAPSSRRGHLSKSKGLAGVADSASRKLSVQKNPHHVRLTARLDVLRFPNHAGTVWAHLVVDLSVHRKLFQRLRQVFHGPFFVFVFVCHSSSLGAYVEKQRAPILTSGARQDSRVSRR